MTHIATPREARNTLLTICAALLIIFCVTHFRLWWLIGIVAALILIHFFLPNRAIFIYRYWMKTAQIIGQVSSTIMLTFIFFLVLTPLAWLARRFSRSNYRHQNITTDSYYILRNHTYNAKDFEEMW